MSTDIPQQLIRFEPECSVARPGKHLLQTLDRAASTLHAPEPCAEM